MRERRVKSLIVTGWTRVVESAHEGTTAATFACLATILFGAAIALPKIAVSPVTTAVTATAAARTVVVMAAVAAGGGGALVD
mmetsp:Transcript_23144/g.41416  ORF Transcript_23144/g.41416 Transcript_23144/m.41416 type:complete len:82 (+) Transcript_23144:562-807(+)